MIYELTDLEADTEYTLSVVAQAEGFTDSDEARMTFRTLQTLLDVPMVQISGVTEMSVSLMWEAQEGVEGLMYQAEVEEEGEAEEISYGAVEASQASSELSGLETGTRYTLRVMASASGYRNSETTMSFTTLEPQLQATLISITNLGVTDATIEWD